MFKKVLVILLMAAAFPTFVLAQSSGKLLGVATDKQTGEPLPGVNVILEGTTTGSATDIDGYYVVLNVPVGVYTIRASYIGYKDYLIENVRVSAGLTTEINFALEPTTLELEEAVVVTAERPLVEKNVTSSVTILTAEDLQAMPVRSFNSLVATSPSVVVQDNNIYIRGGRLEEVGYYLDGASASNPLNNTQAVYVIKEAIEEFQVLAGGYTAEFGGANSGIIRSELKTGSSDYHISADLQTDKLASEGEKFLGTYTYRDHVIVGTLSGPLVPGYRKARIFLAYENNFEGDSQKRFSEGYDFKNVVDSRDPTMLDTIAEIKYPNGFTPNQERDRHALNGTLLFDMSPLKLRASGAFLSDKQQVDDQPMLRVLNDRQLTDENKNALFTLKATYVLSPKSLVEASVNYFNSTLERKDDYFGNNWELWYDSAAVAQHTGGEVTYRDAYSPELNYLFYGFSFERPGSPPAVGTARDFYRIEKNKYIGGNLSFVSQMGRHHEVKVGADIRRHEIRHFDVQPSAIEQKANYGTNLTDIPEAVMGAQGRVNAYGYDNYGREISSDVAIGDSIFHFGPKKPLFMAFYAQDKIEYNDLIINAGLRFDYYDMKDQTLRDPEHIGDVAHPTTGYIPFSAWKKVDPYQQVSPRLGFSFPVSEKTVFYAQYGKFIQMPELNDLYFGSADYRDQLYTGGNFFLAPVGGGLKPIRSTSYEIGFRQQLSTVAAFDIAGFYKNIEGQTTVVRIKGDIGSYNIITNGDFATTQGLELRLTLRRTNRLQTQVNYTLSDAEGTGSNETSYLSAVEQSSYPPKTINPLDFSQAHVGSIVLDYRFGKNDGGPILQELGANFLLSFNSGHPFTRVNIGGLGQVSPYTAGTDYMLDSRSRLAAEPVGNSTTPWNFNVDLQLDKTFRIMNKLGANVYMRVTNLFNSQNVINVYQITGNSYDDGFISNPELSASFVNAANRGKEYVALYDAINAKNGQAYWDQLGLQLWGHPRQIFFGIKLTY
jgi:outer membrane receptor protein involved in Fe transport